MSKINLNLIDRPALFEMAEYIRTVKDGRANEPRINGPIYFLSNIIIWLINRFLLFGLSSSDGSVVISSLLIFICFSGLSLYLDFRRMNDIGVEKDLRNILVMINGFVILFSSLMVAFYDSKAMYNPGIAIILGFLCLSLLYMECLWGCFLILLQRIALM